MAEEYKKYTREEKIQFAKRFTNQERACYKAGIRYGFLQGIHKKSNTKNITDRKKPVKRQYDPKLLNSLFDNIENIEI